MLKLFTITTFGTI